MMASVNFSNKVWIDRLNLPSKMIVRIASLEDKWRFQKQKKNKVEYLKEESNEHDENLSVFPIFECFEFCLGSGHYLRE